MFTEIYQRVSEPKARRKALAMLEAAISVYAKKGFEATTMEMIAREAGVTRPLVKHYFRDMEDLQETAIKYIRVIFQKFAVDALLNAETHQEKLDAYIESCFNWIAHFQSHALAWQAFLHRCAKSPKARNLNTLATSTGEERIISLLEDGKRAGVFQFQNSALSAKLIQAIITGALVCLGSEELQDKNAFKVGIKQTCLSLVAVK